MQEHQTKRFSRVLNFGSMNIDYVYQVDHFLRKGETLSSSGRAIYAGGKGLNQSIALSRAGLQVYHAGSIGKEGTILLDELARAQVDTSNIRILEDVPSGHTVIQNDKEGDNCILLFGGANMQIEKEQVDEVVAQFGEGDLCVLQNEVSNLAYIMEACKKQGMTIVLNPSPINETIRELPLETVSYFFVNEIEAAELSGCDPQDEEALADGMLARFPQARVILTLGEKGALYLSGEERVRQASYPVRAVDTTAAGDTFTGYFLAGTAEGMSPREALDLAARAAAISVTRAGAAPSIPLRSEVDAQKEQA